jgi:hypothetical protein
MEVRGDLQSGDRDYWVSVLDRLARPVLSNLAAGTLRRMMPVEARDRSDRSRYTHLEAFGRLLAGISPWLAAVELSQPEQALQEELLGLTLRAIDSATDPQSPDFLNFCDGKQPLVDSAFLAQAIVRAPSVLRDRLEPRVRERLVSALQSSRTVPLPKSDNWVMFASMVEAALLCLGEKTLEERLEGSVRRMLGWYKGDGIYGDGREFHFDYYNSFVIHPMLVDVLDVLRDEDERFEPLYNRVLRRAARYAEILERLIAPDGTFPCIGRSMAYRFGAFHALAHMSLLHALPAAVTPAQVRCALSAVISRMLLAPATFDAAGWLTVGFSGSQPTVAEPYISTGSLYLCATALLPLGLSPADPFWNAPSADWSSRRLWAGEALPPDHALSENEELLDVPSIKAH